MDGAFGSIESVFQGELLKDERLHWTGKPDPKVIFSPSDILMVPFSLMWGGFAIFWEATVLGLNPFIPGSQKHPAPFFFALWGIPFVLVGLYIIFGRFFYKAWKKERTYYAITDRRVLICTRTRNPQMNALFLDQTAAINRSVRSNGTGTITFGNTSYWGNYANWGMDFLGNRYGQAPFAFYDVPDVEQVYQMLQKLRRAG